MYLTFKTKNVFLECTFNHSPKSPKSLIVIIKRSTENHFWKSKCACLLNYRHLPRKNINKLGITRKNEPSRIQGVNVSKVMLTMITDSIWNLDYVNIYKVNFHYGQLL